jgi:hypothetical protein
MATCGRLHPAATQHTASESPLVMRFTIEPVLAYVVPFLVSWWFVAACVVLAGPADERLLSSCNAL